MIFPDVDKELRGSFEISFDAHPLLSLEGRFVIVFPWQFNRVANKSFTTINTAIASFCEAGSF